MEITKLNSEDVRAFFDIMDIRQGKINLDRFIDSQEGTNVSAYTLRAVQFLSSSLTEDMELTMSSKLANAISEIIKF